jgi:hypothetical protein
MSGVLEWMSERVLRMVWLNDLEGQGVAVVGLGPTSRVGSVLRLRRDQYLPASAGPDLRRILCAEPLYAGTDIRSPGKEAQIVKVTHIAELAAGRVMSTPGLIVDGMVDSSVRVPM